MPRSSLIARGIAATAIVTAVMVACGRAPSASERVLAVDSTTPTSVDLPFPAPTSASEPDRTPTAPPTATPTVAQEPTPEATATTRPTATPRPTWTPSPTPTPSPTTQPSPTPEPPPPPRPTARPTSTPTPTEEPTVTPTETPEPTATPAGPDGVEVGCVASATQIQLDDVVLFEVVTAPGGPPIVFTFNHGDGTTGTGLLSAHRYAAPGTYTASVRWSYLGDAGIIPCGTVEVIGFGAGPFEPGDYLGLAESSATALADSRGFVVRVLRRDDEVFPGTTDIRTDRMNFEIDDGVVTAVSIG